MEVQNTLSSSTTPINSESSNLTDPKLNFPKRKSKKIIIVLFIIILFIILIPLILYLLNKTSKTSQDIQKNKVNSPSISKDDDNPSVSIPENYHTTIQGWKIYSDPQYNYTIELPNEIVYREGRFFNNKYLKTGNNLEDIGDIPYLKLTAAGAGTPKEVYENELYVDSETGKREEAFYEDIKQNNWHGIKLKSPDPEYSYLHYYITSDYIAPKVLEIYFFESPYFHTPSEDIRRFSEKSYLQGVKIQKEYEEMEKTVIKMLSTLNFLDIKDHAANWKSHKTSDGVVFKYPNTFDLDEYDKGAFEVENMEYELSVWKVYVDTRKKGIYSNYDNAVKTIKTYIQNPKEETISGYKVFTGKIASEQAETFFEDTSPNGMNEFFYESDPRKGSSKTVTVALIPFKGGAIAVYTSDQKFVATWLREILDNIKI